MFAGTLPGSWINFSPSPATHVNLSHNQLSGSIPESWGNRSASAYSNYMVWEQVDVSGNPQMCGVIPSWFYSRFGSNAYSLVQGEPVLPRHSWQQRAWTHAWWDHGEKISHLMLGFRCLEPNSVLCCAALHHSAHLLYVLKQNLVLTQWTSCIAG